jgi:peptidoglycan L-alanyl-D-glutamate endopeptidase CwlK
MDATSETRLAAVHPELSRRIHQLADMLSFPIMVVQGLRTYAQQEALFAQGRTTPGPIVTNAHAFQTAHCFMYAVDVAPSDGFSIDWTGKDAKWQELLAKAPSCGLAEGAEWRSFPDLPHLYLQELPATPDAEFILHLQEGGLQSVSQLIDERLAGAKADQS